ADFTEPAQKHFGECGGELALRRCQRLAAVNEMQIEAAHLAERKEMIVPFFRRSCCDGDLFCEDIFPGDQGARPRKASSASRLGLAQDSHWISGFDAAVSTMGMPRSRSQPGV
ncbi:MAG TPA: hypothetical protein VGQ97_02345, partial [Xanthobacteraceae bacterium]|nr:hypothetical protein [Xanthobacteraceae bacterium]